MIQSEPVILSVAEMYQRYSRRVFNLAYRMTGDRTVAEDVLQEVFVTVIEHSNEFRGESSIYTWMYSITKNVCLGIKRRSFRIFEKLISAAEEPSEITDMDKIERLYYVRQIKDGCLTGLLKCLSFHQRIAFIMNVLYNVPTRMIAAVLNKTENSTRILVSRAKSNLRKFLCKNCSLYNGGNRCRCENMIKFSLQNAWITANDSLKTPTAVEAELKEFKSEVLLYKSLSEQDPPIRSPSALLERQDLLILSRTKVK